MGAKIARLVFSRDLVSCPVRRPGRRGIKQSLFGRLATRVDWQEAL
jgi:hypothetical protein